MIGSVILLLAFTTYVLACPFAAMARRHGLKMSDEDVRRAHAKHTADVAAVEKRKRAVTADDIEGTFVLRSRVKTVNSPIFEQGFPVGYSVNGVETPQIDVTVGKTYEFKVMSGCNHPFYLSFDARGRGRAPIPASNFDQDPIQNKICNGAVIKFTPSADLVGKDIYYHCTVHDKMGWKVVVTPESICDKYTEELRSVVLNNAGLVGAVVDVVFQNITGILPMPGDAPHGLLADYFNGAVPQGSRDFLAGSEQSNKDVAKLANDLVSFFGTALGCTDNSIPPYDTTISMKAVHAEMPIGKFEYDAFNDAVIEAMRGFGVRTPDLDAVLSVLNGVELRGAICNIDADCQESLCNKYTPKDAQGNLEIDGNESLIRNVTLTAFGLVLSDPLLKPFFNGMVPPGSVDFVDKNSDQVTPLANKFIAFMGLPGILTCTDPDFPVDASGFGLKDMKEFHANMPITTEVFERFNQHIVTAVANLGVAEADVAAIRTLLASLEPLLCNQPGCSTIPANTATIFDVSVAPKGETHHYPEGFSSAFQIDGEFQEGLVLEVGKKYAFRANQGCFHPFYLSSGTGRSPDITEGVADGNDNYCEGRILEFTPTQAQLDAQQDSTMNKPIFFACRNHAFMGGRICLKAQGAADPPCSANAAQAPLDTLSPCDQLVSVVKAQNVDGLLNADQILRKVVVALFTAGAGTPNAPLRKYFDGTQPMNSTNFLTEDEKRGDLVDGLVKWFGTNMGCSDNSIVLYKPDEPQPNMKTLHFDMDIQQDEFNLFNTVLAGLLQNVPDANVGLPEKALSSVLFLLNSTAPDICSGCAPEVFDPPSLCEKWAAASTVFKNDQKAMLEGVVDGVFAILTGEKADLALEFFDGSTPCNSRSFVGPDNARALSNLKRSLVAFFGSSNVLSCSQSTFPQYRGETDMGVVHSQMPINKALYDAFVDAMVTVITGALGDDVPDLSTDLMAVGSVMYSPAMYATCNQPDCTVGEMVAGPYTAKMCPAPPVLPGDRTTVPGTTVSGETKAPTTGGDGAGNNGTTNAEVVDATTTDTAGSVPAVAIAAVMVVLAALF